MSLSKNIAIKVFFVFVVSLFNFWIYWIFENSFLMGELLIIETVLLFLSTVFKSNKLITLFIFTNLFLLSIMLLSDFDKNIFSTSTIEGIRIEERKQFLGNELGRLYGNRIGLIYFDKLRLIFGKISDNLFSALDLNIYFSPAALIDYGKYSLFFAPSFIVGFLSLILSIKKPVVIYFIVASGISSLTRLDSKLAAPLIFPLISLCIAIGTMRLGIFIQKVISKRV